MFLKLGSFCPLPGLLRAITFSAPKPPPLQISAYATAYSSLFSKKSLSYNDHIESYLSALFFLVIINKFCFMTDVIRNVT